jgi:hypothetical protein
MSAACEQLTAYADGELDAPDADAFAHHLAGCVACQAGLHDALQLAALEAALRAQLAPAHPARSAAPARPRRTWRHVAPFAAAAAALLAAVWWARRPAPRPLDPPLALATASVRTTEGRVAYGPADRYRPYEVVRAGAGASSLDAIPLGTLAELEHRGDLHGVAAALLLMNDAERAAAYLDRAAPGPDVACDRALVQRATGHPTEALITLDGVLETAPRHPQALWNRALVLGDLGLTLSAAAAFDAVAALDEPGWAAEARARAKALSEQTLEQRAASEQLAFKDGPRLATAPGAVTEAIARRFPGTTRSLLYDAVRSASSVEAVQALAPLASTLDAIYGGTVLAAYVERIGHAEFARRAPLARRYAALLAGQRLDEAGTRELFEALRAANQPDILIGAMLRATAAQVPPRLVPELRRLADELRDPWFQLFATERAAQAKVAAGDHAAAEALVLPALARCEAAPIDFRCANLDRVLGDSYLASQRLPEARRAFAEGWARVRRAGEWYIAQPLLQAQARLAAVQDDLAGSTLPLVRAYAGEVVLRQPERCELAAWQRELVALMMLTRPDLGRARDELAAFAAIKRSCPAVAPELAILDAEAYVLRDPAAGSAGDVAALRAEIEALRAAQPGPADRAPLDQIEGRLLIDRDHAAGAALLGRAIAGARAARPDDVDARRARSYAFSILDLDAGRAGDWDRVWSLLGDEAGFTPAARCALGAVVEDRATLMIVRDLAGASHGALGTLPPGSTLDAASLVPAALQAALRGCATVDVVARAPIHGLPGLLPGDLAWSYRSSAAPTGATAGRHRRVVISNPEPPAALGLARLAPWRSTTPPDVVLDGASATPSRVLADLADASFVEIHAHGMVSSAVSDASFVMLSPEADGRYALTASEIRHQVLRGHPIVILAACHAATTASYRHEAWSLPTAFIAAGARAVIASTDVISDGDAGAFFDDLRVRIEQGAAPELALRDTRSQWLAAHPAAAWTRSLMVFQ